MNEEHQRNSYAPKSLWGELSHEDSLFMADILDKPWSVYRELGSVGDYTIIVQCRDLYKEYNRVIPRVIQYPQWRLVTLREDCVVDSCYLRGLNGVWIDIVDGKLVIKIDADTHEYNVTDMPYYIDTYANRFPDDFSSETMCCDKSESEYYSLLIIHPNKDSELLAKSIAESIRSHPIFDDELQASSIEELMTRCFNDEKKNSDAYTCLTVVPIWLSPDKRYETYRGSIELCYFAAGAKVMVSLFYFTLDNQRKCKLISSEILDKTALEEFAKQCDEESTSSEYYLTKILTPDVGYDEDVPNLAIVGNGLVYDLMGEPRLTPVKKAKNS